MIFDAAISVTRKSIQTQWELLHSVPESTDIKLGGDDGIDRYLIPHKLQLRAFTDFEELNLDADVLCPVLELPRDAPAKIIIKLPLVDPPGNYAILRRTSKTASPRTLLRRLNGLTLKWQVDISGRDLFDLLEDPQGEAQTRKQLLTLHNSGFLASALLRICFLKQICSFFEVEAGPDVGELTRDEVAVFIRGYVNQYNGQYLFWDLPYQTPVTLYDAAPADSFGRPCFHVKDCTLQSDSNRDCVQYLLTLHFKENVPEANLMLRDDSPVFRNGLFETSFTHRDKHDAVLVVSHGSLMSEVYQGFMSHFHFNLESLERILNSSDIKLHRSAESSVMSGVRRSNLTVSRSGGFGLIAKSSTSVTFHSDLTPNNASWFQADTANLGNKPHAHRLMVRAEAFLDLSLQTSQGMSSARIRPVYLLQVQVLSLGWVRVTILSNSTLPEVNANKDGFVTNASTGMSAEVTGSDAASQAEVSKYACKLWIELQKKVEFTLDRIQLRPFLPLGAVFMYSGLDTDREGNLFSKINFASQSGGILFAENSLRLLKLDIPCVVNDKLLLPDMCPPPALEQLPSAAQEWMKESKNLIRFQGKLCYDKLVGQRFLAGRLWNPVEVLVDMKPENAWPKSIQTWIDKNDGSISLINVRYNEGYLNSGGIIPASPEPDPNRFTRFGLELDSQERIIEMAVGTYGVEHYLMLRTNKGQVMEAFNRKIPADRFAKTVFQPPKGFPYLKTWYAWVSSIRVDGVGPCWGARNTPPKPFYGSDALKSMSGGDKKFFEQQELWEQFPNIMLSPLMGNMEDQASGAVFFDAIKMREKQSLEARPTMIELFFADYDPTMMCPMVKHVLTGVAVTINGNRFANGNATGVPVVALNLLPNDDVRQIRLECREFDTMAVSGIQIRSGKGRQVRYAGIDAFPFEKDPSYSTYVQKIDQPGQLGFKGFWGYATPGQILRIGAIWG